MDSRAIEIKVNGEWKYFSSVGEGARYIGSQTTIICRTLKEGFKVKGYEVRYAEVKSAEDN